MNTAMLTGDLDRFDRRSQRQGLHRRPAVQWLMPFDPPVKRGVPTRLSLE